MARFTGAVRFPDGEVLFFVYDGVIDYVRPRLFATVKEAEAAWDDRQLDAPRYETSESDELVDVMPFYAGGNYEVAFQSLANRQRALVTGPLHIDDSFRLQEGRS